MLIYIHTAMHYLTHTHPFHAFSLCSKTLQAPSLVHSPQSLIPSTISHSQIGSRNIMGHSRFLLLLLVSSLLFLSFDYGFGRVALMETVEHGDSTIAGIVEHDRNMRVTKVEIMDYAEPEPNTNPKNGYIFSPPSPTPAPPPRA